jgi:hypothetical protein
MCLDQKENPKGNQNKIIQYTSSSSCYTAVEIGPLKQEMQQAAAEMTHMRRTAGYTSTDHKTNPEIAKELNITPVLYKIQDYNRNWIQHVNQMPHNRLPRLIKKLHPKRQKEPRKTTEDTSGYVRLEWVNKWPNSLIAT